MNKDKNFEIVKIGIYAISEPQTEWQKEVMALEKPGQVFKPVICVKGDKKQPGIAQYWFEPVVSPKEIMPDRFLRVAFLMPPNSLIEFSQEEINSLASGFLQDSNRLLLEKKLARVNKQHQL